MRQRYGGGARLVCFSSSSAELGVVGQATYGAANAFVDELCGGDAIQVRVRVGVRVRVRVGLG